MNKLKFKIGEFSKLNQVSIKTLRHYEEIGLLTPFEIDEWTGYRYYNVEQFHILEIILYLKKLGLSLGEIKELFDEGNEIPNNEMIKNKIRQCEQDLSQLQWRYAELNSLAKQIQKEKTMENIFIKSLPARIVASYRTIIKSYNDLFYLCPNVIGPEMLRLGCTCPEPEYCFTIDHNKEYKESDIDIEYCEAVTEKKEDSKLIRFKEIEFVPTAICMNHHGSYLSFPKTFALLFEHVEKNGYEITDHPRFCYIDGIWNKDSEEDWLTEIQIPVKTI